MAEGAQASLDREGFLRVERLKKYFPVKGGVIKTVQDHVQAVDDVSFAIRKGETLGVVGESGCGKSTLGRTLLHLLEPTEGTLVFDGTDVSELSKENTRVLRQRMQMVFQDPASSLNPRMTIKQIVGEPLQINDVAKGTELDDRVKELLDTVGLKPEHLNRYPHEFSGGQKQRIGIARALALNPDFVVLDEPTSALDVSVQAQVLNLLKDLQDEFDLTYLFITHELNVINHISDRVAVMYLGRFVELADTASLFDRRLHPYTKALLSAIPLPDPTADRERIFLTGDVPSPVDPPAGCRFHPRCPIAESICDWSGERFAHRIREAMDDPASADVADLRAVFGRESGWETDRSQFRCPAPDDRSRAEQRVRDLLADEVQEHYAWFDVRVEDGQLVVDFEPQLVPRGGTREQDPPFEDAREASSDHQVACFFAGKEIPEEAIREARMRLHGELEMEATGAAVDVDVGDPDEDRYGGF